MIIVSSLKSFIKSVRSSKTIAEERSVIRKESAKIRTHFRDVNLDQSSRRILISKLLYLYILGEPTHFGQMECIKLLASGRFVDKKLGYMAASLLLDENQEVLTLLTNSLNNDMNHSSQYVIGLAITTLGNIASPELARDLYTDVEKIVDSPNPFLRKKAAMCASRLVAKDPDLSEIFGPKLPGLVADKNHAVLLGVMKLIDVIYRVDESTHDVLVREIAPKILVHLRRLITSVHSPDYDVNGIPDPFLFCAILQTLRQLFESVDDGEPLEQFNDLLTQISSKIDSTKNSGHAILYEAVKTIFHINSDPSLKVLGVNILGKFLAAKDNNTKYVALNTLLTVVHYEPQAVQRHRSTILACLIDADVSIRRRALELAFGILNEQNIRVITKEILAFLENSDVELKSYVTTQLTLACERYSPNDKWHFETLIKMLRVAGNHVTGDIISNILALTLQNQDQELTRHVLITLFQSTYSKGPLALQQYGLSLVTIWCLGEFAELILNSTVDLQKGSTTVTVTETAITDLISDFIESSTLYKDQSNVETLISYSMTAILKLSSRFHSTSEIERLRQLLILQSNSSNLEIQTRSIEFLEIFHQPEALKKGLLEKMPAPPLKQRESVPLTKRHDAGLRKVSNQRTTTEDLLLDLMGGDEPAQSASAPAPQRENTVDLLSDIFGSGTDSTATAMATTTTTTPASSNNGLMDLFPAASASGPPAPSAATPTATNGSSEVPADLQVAHASGNVKVGFVLKSIGDGDASIDAYIVSTTATPLSNVTLLVAVPKTQKLKMSSGNSTALPAQDAVIRQGLSITGKPGAKIKLRVKLNYESANGPVEEQFDFANFGKTL